MGPGAARQRASTAHTSSKALSKGMVDACLWAELHALGWTDQGWALARLGLVKEAGLVRLMMVICLFGSMLACFHS